MKRDQTMIEKIFSRASGKDVFAGDYAWLKLNLVAMRDFGGPNVVQEYRLAFGDRKIFNKDQVAVTFDLHIPPRDEKVAVNQQLLRQFAKDQGAKLFDVNTGIGQHILMESGMVKPWDVIIGTDSHMNLLGAVGAAGFGMGTTDVAGAMYKGSLWFRVPETIKMVLNGTMPAAISSKDIILHILSVVRTDGALHKAIEFTGEAVLKMPFHDRITIASMVTEMSGEIGLLEPNDSVKDFLDKHKAGPFDTLTADNDGIYESIMEFDISKLAPLISCPHSPDNVERVTDMKDVKVDQVFIGSCTNGRYEDLASAAGILKGKKISNTVRMIIVPATMEVAMQASNAGLFDIFMNAGVVITNPGCALCTTGHPGILAPGETMISTSNRNFHGKLGKGASVYLASPATAAASAITGYITDPREA
ncbi:hypothetical protein A2Y85_06420 [candidate division WOR-3 bacterium RBG_13_43_14]|uniref:Aconitase/3-isopropylmalate dehydratase large subunit alpha/beta/alpha domain-containing protein n=1 Tax=candidate division WOR-3 bacterium RBG_13_43_14 TaxID=1802590 RepID=A0A1F4UAN4_UNCW3|nr:MAG: hypothetical protein A2Y85_06420 [candidate division WOR-3 bacterium RBG_13_43_14]